MNILVTGSTGFIGKHLINSLEALDHKVFSFSSKDGDIFNYDFIKEYENITIDCVYHLAGKTFVPDSWNNPTSFINTNVLGTLNILKFCDSKKLPLIFISAYVYGNDVRMPIDEDTTPKPNNPYALSKYMAENLCNFYSIYKNMDINIFRPFNVYGVGQDKRFLIPEIMLQVKNNMLIEVNTLKPKRDYIYIDDLVDGLISGMNSFNGIEIYNLGSGASISVEQVINIIKKQSNSEVEFISRNIERENEINDVVADISKARDKLSWSPKISFDNGIKKIISKS
mgnify:CR=1 FL=1|tara:strand:+ start:4554 stop:5402 length:849 start_codon:yes stop_codon:yes gene_type:complete